MAGSESEGVDEKQIGKFNTERRGRIVDVDQDEGKSHKALVLTAVSEGTWPEIGAKNDSLTRKVGFSPRSRF